jgi:hypothetical protein
LNRTVNMRTSVFLAAFLASVGAQASDASSSTRGFFSPSWTDGEFRYNIPTATASVAASVAGINAKATTYHVGCGKDTGKSDCYIPTSITIIQGPETVNYNAKFIASSSEKSSSWEVTFTESYECSLHSWYGSASCSMSMSATGSENGAKYATSNSGTTTYTTAPETELYYELTVTGGLESFTAPAATETPGAAAAGPAGSLITAVPMVAAAAVAALL